MRLHALQHRKEAAHVVELERWFKVLDMLIQRASMVVSSYGKEGHSCCVRLPGRKMAGGEFMDRFNKEEKMVVARK